jgi:glycerate dehydrogenase
MQEPVVLVSFVADREMHETIEQGLGDRARLEWLDTVQDRAAAIRQADVIMSWNTPREFHEGEYALMEHTRLLQLLSAGADHVPFQLLPETLTVAGNVGAYGGPMAEHVLAMTLALAKNLREQHLKLAAGTFDQYGMNKALRGSTVAILGLGGIGKATAALMRAFGAHVLAINTSGRTDEPVEFIGTTRDLQQVLGRADVVVISMPLTNATRGLIGAEQLSWMKPDAILVNVARGEIIDEHALYEHLRTHPQFKAGIDAWWVEPFRHGHFEMHEPFLALPNVLGSPHNSGMVPQALQDATKEAVQNVQKFLAGQPIKGVFRREEYLA